jgi:hypothetical protein
MLKISPIFFKLPPPPIVLITKTAFFHQGIYMVNIPNTFEGGI